MSTLEGAYLLGGSGLGGANGRSEKAKKQGTLFAWIKPKGSEVHFILLLNHL